MVLQRDIEYYIRPRMVLYDADNGIIEWENIIEDRQWYYRRQIMVLQQRDNSIVEIVQYYRRQGMVLQQVQNVVIGDNQ